MGNSLTFISRLSKRKIRRFQVRERAEKVINEMEATKPKRAPMYEATMREVEKLAKEMPDLTEEIKKKDLGLLKNLEKVYVSSQGDNIDGFTESKVELKPQQKKSVQIWEEEETQIAEARPGKYTTTSLVNLLEEYSKYPVTKQNKVLAEKYLLDPEKVASITTYVKIFDLIKPAEVKKTTALERLQKDVLPKAMVGLPDHLLMEEVLDERDRRMEHYARKFTALEEARKRNAKIVEEVHHVQVYSKETRKKLDILHVDAAMYDKFGVIKEDELKLVGQSPIVKRLQEEHQKLIEGKEVNEPPTQYSEETMKKLDEIYGDSTKKEEKSDAGDNKEKCPEKESESDKKKRKSN